MKTFKAQSQIGEIIGAAIAIIILIAILAIFASAPNPIGSIFTSLLNEILAGISIIIIAIVILILLKLFRVI